jgi:RNA polymerase sigma factor (sigma-70 family)
MPNQDVTRLTLIQRIVKGNGDEQCWEEFVSCYQGFIFMILRKFNLSDELCRDLKQDILLLLWKDLPKFEYRPHSCRFRTWLSVVCRNAAMTYLKSKAGKKASCEVNYDEVCSSLDNFSEPEIEEIAENEWKVFISEKAVAKVRTTLSEKLLEILDGTLLGKSDDEMANELSTANSAVRVYRHRVKNALLKEIIRLNSELDF